MAIRWNIIIDQGANAEFSYTVTDDDNNVLDLTDYEGYAQMRKHFSSSNAVSFDVSLGGNTGVILLSMNAETTGTLTNGRYVYDCEIVSPTGGVTRIVEGIVTVTPQVTRT